MGGALFAATALASTLATVSSVSADIGDGAQTAGFVRDQPDFTAADPNDMLPVSPTWQNQPAPVIQAGTTAAKANGVQLLIPSNWESGDKIILQVQADGVAPAAHSTNCLDAARTINVAGPYDATNVSVAGPWAGTTTAASAWNAANDSGDTVADAGTSGAPGIVDVHTPDATPSVAPTFRVELGVSPSCGGLIKTDQIVLTFTNTATGGDAVPTATDGFFQLTFSNIKYDVGAGVQPGPVHVIPFALDAVDSSPGAFQPMPTFGGNIYQPLASPYWTNNAYISPVSISATGNNIVADNYTQALGSITLTELTGDALVTGPHQVCTNVNLSGTLTVAITGNTGATGTATASGTCINLVLAGMVNTTSGTVTISGLNASTTTPGPVAAWLVRGGDAGNWPNYLNPDDQAQGMSGATSDVNLGAQPTTVFALAIGVPSRIGGNDRYETSAKIASNESTCTEWAVVASGTSYPDALSANYLAGALDYLTDPWSGLGADMDGNVPVLLVAPDAVPSAVAAYLSSAGVKHVYIVGGTAAVSAAVQAQLANTLATRCSDVRPSNSTQPVSGQKLEVVRVAGADRYTTNRAVVNLAVDFVPNWGNRNMSSFEILGAAKHTAIVATGQQFADALSAGPLSYWGYPLVLTDGTALSAAARTTLTDNDITQVIIVGGTAAVSDTVKSSIESLGIVTQRIAGADRYATAAAVADFVNAPCALAPVAGAFDCGMGGVYWGYAETVLLASGVTFADALSGGPLAAMWDSPILLTDPATLSTATKTWLTTNASTVDRVVVLGLGSAVSTAVMNAANVAIS